MFILQYVKSFSRKLLFGPNCGVSQNFTLCGVQYLCSTHNEAEYHFVDMHSVRIKGTTLSVAVCFLLAKCITSAANK